MKISNKATIIAIITFIEIFMNVIMSGNISSGLFIALCDILLLAAMIEALGKPVLSELLLLTSQVISIVYNSIDGNGIQDGLMSAGITGMIVVIGFIACVCMAFKEIDKHEKNIKNVINYKKVINKTNIATRIIVYSVFVSCIFSLANSDTLVTISNNTGFRIYSAFVLIIEVFLVISIALNCTMMIDFQIIRILGELYAISQLIMLDNFDFTKAASILPEIITVTYMIYIVCKRKKNENRK